MLMLLAFGLGYCMGKQMPEWSAGNSSRQPNAAQIPGDTANETAAEHPDGGVDNGNSGTEEANNMTAEDNHHDIFQFGKLHLPDPTSATGIIMEMSSITFTDGKYRTQTFEEVWSTDRNKSYKRWLQQRLHQIDIGYSAYVVYAELKELTQR